LPAAIAASASSVWNGVGTQMSTSSTSAAPISCCGSVVPRTCVKSMCVAPPAMLLQLPEKSPAARRGVAVGDHPQPHPLDLAPRGKVHLPHHAQPDDAYLDHDPESCWTTASTWRRAARMSATRSSPASRSMHSAPENHGPGQHPEERRPVDLAGAHHHLAAPGARLAGEHGVLDVDLPDVGQQHAERLHRVALVVEDHVGRVEVHAHVRRRQLVEEAHQHPGLLLPGLERQLDPGVGEDPRQLAQAPSSLP
jgi:hypothetical protein